MQGHKYLLQAQDIYLAMSGEAILFVTTKGFATGIWWVESRDAAKHSGEHKKALHTMNSLSIMSVVQLCMPPNT